LNIKEKTISDKVILDSQGMQEKLSKKLNVNSH